MEIKFWDIGDPPAPGEGEWPADLVASLLPCAHCGLPAHPLGDLYGYQVVCAGWLDRSCAIQTDHLITTAEQAAAVWNRRVSDAIHEAAREALRFLNQGDVDAARRFLVIAVHTMPSVNNG